MTATGEEYPRPRVPVHDARALRGRAEAQRAQARTLRREAEALRTHAAGLRLVSGARHAAASDVAELRRRIVEAETRSAHLQIALTSNRRIGMAVGILMARYQLTEDQAFDRLRQQSSRRNVKVARLAEDVIYTGRLEPDAGAVDGRQSPSRPMSKKPLAAAHRQLGTAEHGVERRMLDQADSLERADVTSDPQGMRQKGKERSSHAERHLREAARLENDRRR